MRGKLWTEQEDEELMYLKGDGLTNREISDRMEGRTFCAVIGRFHRIGGIRKVSTCRKVSM